MMAGLRQYLMLAGVGLAGGFALIVAVLGPGELTKRATSIVAPDDQPRSFVGKPGEAAPRERPPSEKRGAETPIAEGSGKQAALPPAEGIGKPAGKDGPKDARRNAPQDAAKDAAKPGAPVSEEAPSLDIVRVEPNGDAVIAGRTAPKAEVEILRDNKPIARATADESGQFAIVPPTLPTGNSEISYRSVAPDGKATKGRESVAIVVAENRATKPLVAVSTPDKPTVVLSQPEIPTAASPGATTAEARKALAGKAEGKQAERSQGKLQEKPQRMTALPEPQAAPGGRDGSAPVKVVSIDAQEGGRLDVSGVAKPGASLRLYLNDTLVASGKSGPDGRIAFTIGRGVRPGGYQIRIDAVEPATGKVEHRAQVAFAFPESALPRVASRETPAAASAPPPLPARPDADRPAGILAGRAPSTRDGNAVSGASPPPAPAVEARAANRPAEAGKEPGKEPSRSAKLEPQRQASRAESAPEPAPVAAVPKPEAPASEPNRRLAETPAPNRLASGARAEPGVPSPKPPQPSEGMKADAPNPGGTASVTLEPSDKPGSVFVPEISTARITRGDNLWQISRRTYGNGLRYTVIFDANKEQIRDPDLIYPGQIFVLPSDQAAKRG